MSTAFEPVEAEWVTELRKDARLGMEMVAILSHYCGERGGSEGAVETLTRIIKERSLRESVVIVAEQRIREFDSCIQNVAGALGACCGGVDGDQSEPGATTRVLLDAISGMRVRLIEAEDEAKRQHDKNAEIYVHLCCAESALFATKEPACVCGNPNSLGVVHRADRPCFLYTDDPMPEPLDAEKKLHVLYVAWLTGDPRRLVMAAGNIFTTKE